MSRTSKWLNMYYNPTQQQNNRKPSNPKTTTKNSIFD